jgi:hypothetical protein
MRIIIISLLDQLGLWVPFSGVQNVFPLIIFSSEMMIISRVGQLGLWAPSSGVQDVFTPINFD